MKSGLLIEVMWGGPPERRGRGHGLPHARRQLLMGSLLLLFARAVTA